MTNPVTSMAVSTPRAPRKPGRTLDTRTIHNQAVRIYKNLHRKTFSVMLRATGLVVLHTDHIILTNAKFTVNRGGQARALREGRRNVHAFVDGTYDHLLNRAIKYTEPPTKNAREVTYNPWRQPGFHFRDTGEETCMAEFAVCVAGRIFVPA